jgi:RHS repeat-associated protein
VTTTFLYDGANLVGEYSSTGTILGRYVTGPGVDEPVVWYQGSGTSTRNWLTADNQGSVIGYADQSGNSEATYTYGPYGEPITSGGASAWGGSRYRFTGQIEIPEAQLYYYKARVYDPSLGRFYQADPAGYGSDVNSYAYAGNDPINTIDPNGLGTSGLLITGNGVSGGFQATSGQICFAAAAPSTTPPGLGGRGSTTTTVDPCTNATLAATGVNPKQNIAQVNKYLALKTAGQTKFGGYVTSELMGYADLVGTGGPQDVKNQPGPGTYLQRIAAGNISYGITCPFGTGFCQFAAGLAQTLRGRADFTGTLQTGFDTPSDNAQIRVGQAMVAAGCFK